MQPCAPKQTVVVSNLFETLQNARSCITKAQTENRHRIYQFSSHLQALLLNDNFRIQTAQ